MLIRDDFGLGEAERMHAAFPRYQVIAVQKSSDSDIIRPRQLSRGWQYERQDIENYDDVDDFFYIKMSSGADYTLVITSVTMEDDAKFQCQVFQIHKNSSYHSGKRWSFDF